MSEYQYYEFQTIDHPLNTEQIAYLHTLSRRAQITSSSAIYTYSFGDFPTEPLKVLVGYFDAMLYVANWGSKQLAFRFPNKALDSNQLKAYFAFDEMSLERSGEHLVLNIEFNPEEGVYEWIEAEGLLSHLAPLRNEIMAGDLRALYLVWLKAALNYEVMLAVEGRLDAEILDDELAGGDPELIEPPIPPGLQQITPALQELIAFLELNSDVVTAAAQASPPLALKSEPYEEWVTQMPIDERNDFLIRVARGDSRVGIDLLLRLREIGQGVGTLISSSQPRRSFIEIKSKARAQRHLRQQNEREAADRKWRAKLDALAKRETDAWQEVGRHLAKRSASGYDSATALLGDLHELAAYRRQEQAFAEKFAQVVEPYLRSDALRQRVRNMGLL